MGKSKVTEATIRDILMDHSGIKTLAKRHGISHQAVSQIRRGITHAGVLPNVPRWIPQAHSCSACIQWSKGQCSLDLPESREDLSFANECNLFQKP